VTIAVEHRSPHSPAGLERTDAGLGVDIQFITMLSDPD
jgi:hypothetical protein